MYRGDGALRWLCQPVALTSVVEDRWGEVVLGLPVLGRGADLNDNASDLDVTLAISCWLSRLASVASPLWGFSI